MNVRLRLQRPPSKDGHLGMQEPQDVVSDGLEIAHALLLKAGSSMPTQLPAMAEAFLLCLSDGRSSTRKKATHCLGAPQRMQGIAVHALHALLPSWDPNCWYNTACCSRVSWLPQCSRQVPCHSVLLTSC